MQCRVQQLKVCPYDRRNKASDATREEYGRILQSKSGMKDRSETGKSWREKALFNNVVQLGVCVCVRAPLSCAHHLRVRQQMERGPQETRTGDASLLNQAVSPLFSLFIQNAAGYSLISHALTVFISLSPSELRQRPSAQVNKVHIYEASF